MEERRVARKSSMDGILVAELIVTDGVKRYVTPVYDSYNAIFSLTFFDSEYFFFHTQVMKDSLSRG